MQLRLQTSKGWTDWLPIQSPLTGGGNEELFTPATAHIPITTRKGRVVYNRKPHRFSDNDLLRISADIYGADRNTGIGILAILERITIWMLERIFEKMIDPGQADLIAEPLYYYMRDTLARIIDRLPGEVRAQADEYLSQVYGL
jgi:hypothetical protein